MTEHLIKNCSTCGHSTPGEYSSQELQGRRRFCNLCGDYCKEVNYPLYQDFDWSCKAHNQWVPQPPSPPKPLTIWQKIGTAILARISPDNQLGVTEDTQSNIRSIASGFERNADSGHKD